MMVKMCGKVGYFGFRITYDGRVVVSFSLFSFVAKPGAKPEPGPGIDDRLRAAYVEFSNLCKQHKIRTWV